MGDFMETTTWNGYRQINFTFEDREAILVFPEKADEKHNWALKMEYWTAFQGTELALVERGFHLAFLKNHNRWATPEDCAAKARFVHYLHKTYGLRDKCVPVGMSCGGAFSVNFAGWHPECVAAMFLDAPVVNFCSCPAYMGGADRLSNAWENEFVKAYPGITRSRLLNFYAHPINRADVLVRHRIPIAMCYGTQDSSVPWEENGQLLVDRYQEAGAPIAVFVRNFEGHHPHGLKDPTPVAEYIIEHTR